MPSADRRSIARARAVSVATMVLLIGFSIEGVHTKLGSEVATLAHSLRSAHLSRLDNAKLERGYYEGLLSVDRFNSQLWEVYAKRPANWLEGGGAGLKRFVGGFAQIELVPSVVLTTSHGTITTNRWGLRDKDYAATRPAGTLRAAVLGPSTVMGSGVADGETFESLLEQRLNTQPLSPAFAHVELLNFGVPGYQPPQQMVAFERSLALQPNAVFYVATGREPRRSAQYLAEAVDKRLPIPYPALQAILDEAGVRADMDEAAAMKRLEPYGERILQVVYDHIARGCRERGIRPLWIFLPQVREGSWQEETPAAVKAAQKAGFAVIRLDDVYKGRDITEVRMAEWDDHPNALGHRIVADALYAAFAADPVAVFGPPSK